MSKIQDIDWKDGAQGKTGRKSDDRIDFNLTPILAEAYFSQISSYFAQHAELDLKTGQVSYQAVAESEHAGKPICLV